MSARAAPDLRGGFVCGRIILPNARSFYTIQLGLALL